MARATDRSSYDAVIVGGGHNGLTAAAYLARAGRSVLVLERRAQLGGAAVSERTFAGVDARLSRYSYLVSLLPAQIIDELSLKLTLAARKVSSYTPDPRDGGARGLLVDSSDTAATRASFQAVTGGRRELDAWEAFYAMTRKLAEVVFPTLTKPLRAREQLRAMLGDDGAWEAIFERPLQRAIEAAFDDDLVAGVVLTDALIGTFAAADDAGLRQNRCFLYHVIGGRTGEWRVPLGGMGAVSAALAGAARAAGAELRTRAEVLSIEPEATGVDVRFSDGAAETEVHAEHVLVGAAPSELERLLGDRRRPAPRGLTAEGQPDALAAAAPEGRERRRRARVRRHLPRQRERRAAAARLRAGRRRAAARAAAV